MDLSHKFVPEVNTCMTSETPWILNDGEFGVVSEDKLSSTDHRERMLAHTRELFKQLYHVGRVLADVNPQHHVALAREIMAWKKAVKGVFDFGQHYDPHAVVAAADDALNAALKPYEALLHAEDTMQMLGLKHKQHSRESVEAFRRANFRYGVANIVGARVTSLPNMLPGVGGRMVPVQDFDNLYN